MLYQATTHDHRVGLTPSQARWAEERKARKARFCRRAIEAPPTEPVDKTIRPKVVPLPAEVEQSAPKPPEPWFYLIMMAVLARRFEEDAVDRRPRVEEIIRVVAECYNVT